MSNTISLALNYGVYVYLEPDTQSVVYVGIDSNIDKHTRHKEHTKPSKVNDQVINQMIRNHNLVYAVVATVNTREMMYKLEQYMINEYKPKYNVKVRNT